MRTRSGLVLLDEVEVLVDGVGRSPCTSPRRRARGRAAGGAHRRWSDRDPTVAPDAYVIVEGARPVLGEDGDVVDAGVDHVGEVKSMIRDFPAKGTAASRGARTGCSAVPLTTRENNRQHLAHPEPPIRTSFATFAHAGSRGENTRKSIHGNTLSFSKSLCARSDQTARVRARAPASAISSNRSRCPR